MRRILGRAAALALIAGLCATIPTAGASSHAHTAPALTLPAHPDGLSQALASGRISPAKEALLRAQALFRPATVAAVYGPVAHSGGEATMILRDLAVRLDGLTPSDRKTAHAILARPSDSADPQGNAWTVPEAGASPDCGPNVCIHWASGTGGDAPNATDTTPANGIPDYVDQALAHCRARVEPGGRHHGLPGAAVRRDLHEPRPRRQTRHLPQQPGAAVPVRLLHERRPQAAHARRPGRDLGRVGLLRSRQQLHGADLPESHPDSEPEGDARPRVLPRGAVRLRRR